MKLFFVLFFSVLTFHLFAGEIIKSKIQMNGEEYLWTAYVEDEWIKIMDIEDHMIFDMQHEKVTILDPENKRFAQAEIKEFNELFTSLQRTALENAKRYGTPEEKQKIEKMVDELMSKTKKYEENLKFQATKKQAEIIGHKCKAYQVIENGYVIEIVWKTEEISAQGIFKSSKALASITPVKTYETSDQYLQFLKDGCILKTNDLIDETVTTVESYLYTKIPASVFFVPEGFTQVTLLEYFKGNEN